MVDLAQLLQPQQQAPTGPQVPLSPQLQAASQVGLTDAPQQTGATPGVTRGAPARPTRSPEEFERKKTGWKDVLSSIARNPDGMAALLVMGHRLTRARLPHETGLSRMSDAVMQSRAQLGRSTALRQALKQKKVKMLQDMIKMQLEQQRVKISGRQADASQQQANVAQGRLNLARSQAPMDAREQRARISKLMAEADREALGKTIPELWATVVEKIMSDPVTAQIADLEQVKRDFRMMHDLPETYQLGHGGESATRTLPTAGEQSGVAAPTDPLDPNSVTGTGTDTGTNTGTGTGAKPRQGLLDSSKLQVGRRYGTRVWNPKGGSRDASDPNNWSQ